LSRALAAQLQGEIDARALAAVRARQSTLDWRVVTAVINPTIAGRGGTATVTDGRGNATFGWRWLERRPLVGDVVLVEIPPPGGTRRIVAIDREIVDTPVKLPIFSADYFGIAGDGSTIDTQTINQALAAIGGEGGGILMGTPGGVYAVDQALSFMSALTRFDLNGGHLQRVGPSTDPVVWIHTPGPTEAAPNGAATKIVLAGLSNGSIDGGGVAQYGVRVTSVNQASLQSLRISGGTAWQVYMDCWDVRPGGGDPRDNQVNALRDLFLDATGITLATGLHNQGGLCLTGNPSAIDANSSLNRLDNVWVDAQDGDAVFLQNADGNIFSHLRTSRFAGAGRGLVMAGYSVAGKGHARHNQFFGIQIANSAGIYHLTNTQPAGPNLILGNSLGNSGGTITDSTGTLSYLNDDGTGNIGGGGGAPSGPAGGDLGSSYPTPTVLQASTTFGFSGTTVTDTSTGNIVDLAITNSRYRWNGASAATLCGIAGGTAGRMVLVQNMTAAQVLTLANQSGTEATTTNRMTMPGAVDLVLNPGDAVMLYYTAASRWAALAPGLAAVARSGSASDLTTGTLPAGRTPAYSGDVTSSAGGTVNTLAAGNAGNLNSGTLLAARMPALTGDVTTSAGAVATTIAARAVTAAKLFAATATSRFLLRKTASGGDWEEGTAADAKTILAITESDVASLTTDLAAKAATGRVATSGLTTATATVVGRATAGTGALEELATTGTGSAVLATGPTLSAPVLGTPASGTLTNATGLPTAGTTFTNTARVHGRQTAGGGAGEELTAANLKTLAGYYTSGDSPSFDHVTLTGAYISFPATQAASAGANDLDDYEEGTFTPVLAYATVGSSTWAITTQAGFYTKIGREVIIRGVVNEVPTNGTGAGNLQMTGLPFTSNATSGSGPAITVAMQGWTKATYSQITGIIAASASLMLFRANGTAVANFTLTVTEIPSAGTVIAQFNGSYMV
jgi:hypothetical protein